MTTPVTSIPVSVLQHTVTVRRIDLLYSVKIQRIQDQVEKLAFDDPDVQVLVQAFYAVLVGCTDWGEWPVPSPDEFVHLDPVEANAWFEAARELNPGMFPTQAEQAEETDEKKEL